MKRMIVCAGAALLACVATAETLSGDFTTAIKAAGLEPTVTRESMEPHSEDNTEFDGWIAATNSAGTWISNRNLIKRSDSAFPASPAVYTYEVPAAFVPGEDVVVTGISFAIGASNNTGGKWGSHINRLPTDWTLDASHDGSSWTNILTVSNCTIYRDVNNATNVYWYTERNVPFHNWRSFRHYRLTITKTGCSDDETETYPMQVGEIMFHGLYGGTVVQPAPKRIDITAAVRDAGDLRTIDANLEPWGGSYGLEKAFNGSCAADGAERYLSSTNSAIAALADGGAWISYEISDSFGRGADVIATGYTFDTYTGHGWALARMPKAWKFQAYDGNGWVTLDEWEDFTMYDTVEVDSVNQYAFTFNFTNNVPYRKYRFLITRQYNDNLAASYRAIQFSELRIWGYVDAGIGGTSIGSSAEYPIDWTFAYTNNCFAPQLSCTHVSTFAYNSVTSLFNGVTSDRLLLQNVADSDSIVVGYEIPASFLYGRETLITNYTLMVWTDWAYYAQRMPRTWKLQGWCADRLGQEAWQTLDSHTGFDGYVTDTAAKSYSASFDLSSNVTSCRKYRFVFEEMQAPVNDRKEFQVTEIFLSGKWGQGISTPPDPPKGTMVIFR